MHLTNWKARRAGPAITINGHDAHGEPRKLVGVAVIECGPHGFFAVDRQGVKHTLAEACQPGAGATAPAPIYHQEQTVDLKHTTPCNECPWRRSHPAGWLGGYTTDDFINQVQFDGPPLPCHKTIPGDGTDARAMCAGALIFMRNSCKAANHPDYGDARDQVQPDPETVFRFPQEFRDHHNNPDAWVEQVKECMAKRAAK